MSDSDAPNKGMIRHFQRPKFNEDTTMPLSIR